MSENVCYTDAYARSTPAHVVETDGNAVLLDRTAFYPGGGGQPSDRGWLVGDRRLDPFGLSALPFR